MKTVKRDAEVRRVSDAEATKLTKSGWSYCPKSEYKKRRRQ